MAFRFEETFEFATRLIKPGPMPPRANTSKTDDGDHTPNAFTVVFNGLIGLLTIAIRRAPKG